LLHDRPENEVPAESYGSRHDHQAIERDAGAGCDWNGAGRKQQDACSKKGYTLKYPTSAMEGSGGGWPSTHS
jgi:hypothetical protein